MIKKAIIFDLDNTIYSVRSIGDMLFRSLFTLVSQEIESLQDLEKIKADLMRRPFQVVAKDYNFSKGLIEKAIHLLEELTYDGPMKPYPDYHFTKELTAEKFLVTTGFPKLQQSKIDALNIASHFKEIHIVDPSTSIGSKKEVFADIMHRYKFKHTDVLVVGDDPESEIKAARELGIDAILYDPEGTSTYPGKKIKSFERLVDYV